MREEAEVLASLGRMGQELLGGLDDPLLCDLLCRRAAELTGADKAQLFLRRDEDGAFAYAASHGLDPTDLETARMLEIPSELFETSAENGKGFPQLPSLPPGDHRTVRLFRGGLCIGALVLSRSRGTFDEKQERILSGIGPVASLAFEAARLFRALEAANSMKSDFIALVSHELRTPLNVILGYVSLLLEGDFGPLGAEQRNVLARVEESARKLCALVGETLELRRLLTARVPVHVAETDVGRVLDEVLAECEEAARRKPLVALRLEPPRSHGTIRTDPAKLASVLRQLVENALKFTESGEVRVGWVEKNGGIEIFVRDTGPGIPEEKVSWIFEPFTQLEPVSTRQHGGAGLGLHLAKRLAELLGGTISVESRPGAGSTFRLWLPFRPPTELEPELFDTVV
ncbi:MAG: hypothetical protein KatS3mg076_1574 [Candidatus Binatia bacterium]|nr:MAG: hypothetical protein KatS3mg076_1574 [Candidatus Binatia bacterium]